MSQLSTISRGITWIATEFSSAVFRLRFSFKWLRAGGVAVINLCGKNWTVTELRVKDPRKLRLFYEPCYKFVIQLTILTV
jgi:hypothetical protein